MSLTIQYTPPIFSSFQDELIFTVVSDKVADPVTYPNFKYIGDVYIGGVLVNRIKKISNPVTGIGVFNIGQIVRNYAATVFNPNSTGLVAQVIGNAAFNLQVTMKFGEEYSFTDFLNVAVDSTRFFFNNYNDRLRGADSSIIAKVNNFASNRQITNGKVLFSSNYFLIPYLTQALTPIFVTITPILASGALGTPFNTPFTMATPWDMQELNLSPQTINSLSPGLLNSGMRGYTVQIDSNIFTVYFICEARYTPYMLHFLNQYGGFDSHLFTKVSRTSFDVTKASFGKLKYTVDGSGAVRFKSDTGVYNETDSTYSSQYTESMVLNSDLLTDAEYIWLKDLLLSPMVYLEDGGYFYPVQISDTNYEPKKTINDDLTNLTISIKFGNQLNAQYR